MLTFEDTGYAAHVLERASENDIAAQEIGYSHPLGSVVDLLLGGGRRHFLPISQGGKRSDNVNLIDWAVEKGWRYVSTKRELDMSTDDDGALPLPFLGLFSPSHMAFELDRDRAEQPSLLEMAKTALDTLEKATRNSEKGETRHSHAHAFCETLTQMAIARLLYHD